MITLRMISSHVNQLDQSINFISFHLAVTKSSSSPAAELSDISFIQATGDEFLNLHIFIHTL